MVRNPFNEMKCMTLKEKQMHVHNIHFNFPRINEDALPDYLVEKYRDCKNAFLEYYWKLSKELDNKKGEINEK